MISALLSLLLLLLLGLSTVDSAQNGLVLSTVDKTLTIGAILVDSTLNDTSAILYR